MRAWLCWLFHRRLWTEVAPGEFFCLPCLKHYRAGREGRG